MADQLPHGSRTLASGAREEKQDNTSGLLGDRWRFLLQAKATRSGSLRVTREEFKQLVEDACVRDPDMRPGWAVQFCGHQQSAPVLEEIVLLRKDDFLEMLWELARGADD